MENAANSQEALKAITVQKVMNVSQKAANAPRPTPAQRLQFQRTRSRAASRSIVNRDRSTGRRSTASGSGDSPADPSADPSADSSTESAAERSTTTVAPQNWQKNCVRSGGGVTAAEHCGQVSEMTGMSRLE